MKTTTTFTEDHIKELERISKTNTFAAKIATTILSKSEYTASSKQVDILNDVSEIMFYVSDNYGHIYLEKSQERQRQLLNI